MGRRDWPGIAGLLQFLHVPSSPALCGCFLMGAVAVGLGDAAFRLLRTAGPGGRVFRVFGAAFLPGPATLELFFLLWAVPGRGNANSKVRPSPRLGGGSFGFRSLEIA